MNLDRIASLAASGLKAAQISTIVGLSPGRLSQLTSTEEYKLKLADKTASLDEKDIEEEAITAKYTAAEHALIDQVMQMAPVSELRDVTAALRVVSERQDRLKQRVNPITSPNTQQVMVVSVSLPAYALPTPVVTLNSQREVLAIDQLELAPMTSKSVQNLFGDLGEYHDTKTSIRSPEAVSAPIVQEPVENSFLEYALGN